MTTVYVLSILLAFSLPGSAWLGWLLYEAREELATMTERAIYAEAESAEWQSANVKVSKVYGEHFEALVKERDAALGNLAMVLNDSDVAGVLDMHKLLRDAAPIIRHRFTMRAVR